MGEGGEPRGGEPGEGNQDLPSPGLLTPFANHPLPQGGEGKKAPNHIEPMAMSSTDSDDDTPAAPQKADHYPSARTLLDLGALLGQHKSEERSRSAWRLVTGASGNPDFHAVLDFALENELVLGCDQPDPAAANATWVNPTDGSQMVWIPRGKFV